MQNFAEQCMDMARSILGHNLESINEDGSIAPVPGEISLPDEPGHAAHAIGEFHRATQETELAGYDLVDLCARALTAQTFAEGEKENGLAYSSLALLCFGPSKDRNIVWERLMDETREQLDRQLLARSDYEDHNQAFNIAKSVARFSMGLSKKDETGRLIDLFMERVNRSSAGLFDNNPEALAGVYDIYGILSLIFIRQALQLHSNMHLRERKLPSLRTCADKYLRILPDIVRADGLGWSYGEGTGSYGQMHCITLILQAMRDGWISEEKKPLYFDILRRLFAFFFSTYLDQEHGFLVIRDAERSTGDNHSTRMANFDAARYLCQWARLARSIGGTMTAEAAPAKTIGRFIVFDKNHRKENGLFVYQNAKSGLNIQIPLVGSNNKATSDSLAFPHAPGIFDWPSGKYLPIMLPELTFGKHVIIPSFYGKHCTTGLGLKNVFFFRYEQPELINTDQKLVSGLGSCRVNWTFSGDKITSEFLFTVKNQIQLDKMRYVIALGVPHSHYRMMNTFRLGPESVRAFVEKDDFQATWADTETVIDDPEYRTDQGNINYLQVLHRDHPLIMRPGQQYRLIISFEPDIQTSDE
jgi:hypothetical protein